MFECRTSGIERYGNARPRAGFPSILTATVSIVNETLASDAQIAGIVRKLIRKPGRCARRSAVRVCNGVLPTVGCVANPTVSFVTEIKDSVRELPVRFRSVACAEGR